MMATTHAFVGLAMAAVVATVAPEYALPAAVGGIAGGLFPDLDLLAVHRRTLHFPALYWVAALPAAALALVLPGPLTVGVALFALAAAVHSASDVLGGSLEMRPWEGTTDDAVYLHTAGRWLPARRWIPYDGSPRDLAVASAFAIPGLVVFDGYVRTAALAGLATSAVYTLVRKRIVDWAPERFL